MTWHGVGTRSAATFADAGLIDEQAVANARRAIITDDTPKGSRLIDIIDQIEHYPG